MGKSKCEKDGEGKNTHMVVGYKLGGTYHKLVLLGGLLKGVHSLPLLLPPSSPSIAGTSHITHPLIPSLDMAVHVWRESDSSDYTKPKNFRPIASLDCIGKLLLKILASCLQDESIKYDLLHPLWFGGIKQ
ncbi:hypothetical protein AX15_004711 [Amanita polypyramis BW_CC]|nr:hypothetical protein AX15_004711 [Amanita polypyramis BW_CC]